MTIATRPVAALLVLCTATPAFAQSAGWHSSLDRAAEVAAKTGRPIFAVFRCER